MEEISPKSRLAVTLFAFFNPNKYSLALNLRHPKAIEIAKRLIAWADIVVEGFTPGVMARWGLSYEDIQKIKADIIMLSCCAQGQTGPHRSLPGFGSLLAGLAGLTYFCGTPDEQYELFGAFTDYTTPPLGAAAIAAALDYRRRTGMGMHLDVSQLEAGVSYTAPLILDCTTSGRVIERVGNRSPYATPHGVYRCKGDDRWVTIAVYTDEEWRALQGVIGEEPWTKEARFATLLGRKENEDELDRLIEQWTANHTSEEVMSLLQEAGVAAGVVHTTATLQDDPQLKHRHYFQEMDHPEIGRHTCESTSYILSKTPAELRMPAPCLGEHTEYVCTQLLGLSDEEFVEFMNEGIFQ